jgi:hypothetical protein
MELVPASTAAMLRRNGKKRATKTNLPPYRTKSHCPILMRPSVIPRRVPYRINSRCPNLRPIQKPTTSPAMAATIAAAMSDQISSPWVLAAKNPAAISAASAGNGMPTLSSAMNAATTQMP